MLGSWVWVFLFSNFVFFIVMWKEDCGWFEGKNVFFLVDKCFFNKLLVEVWWG